MTLLLDRPRADITTFVGSQLTIRARVRTMRGEAIDTTIEFQKEKARSCFKKNVLTNVVAAITGKVKKYGSMEGSICTKIRGEGFSSLINDSERSKLQKNGMASLRSFCGFQRCSRILEIPRSPEILKYSWQEFNLDKNV